MTEQSLDHLVPSQHLPSLSPLPRHSQLQASLDRLQRLIAPHQVVIDLTSTYLDRERSIEDAIDLDDFELTYARQWLERLVSVGSRQLARAEDEVEMAEWEGLMQDGSCVLARLMGGSASGGSEQVFILPSPVEKDDGPLRIHIQETTLLSNSTGFRTWGSAILLAQSIASRPFDYFPSMDSRSPSHGKGPLRVLELGSGTGLVGLTVVGTLSTLRVRSRIDLTDFEEGVLSNLCRNLEKLRPSIDSEILECHISKLDWSDYQSKGSTRPHAPDYGRASYDLIFAADVIYEPQHVELIHATISALLRRPGTGLEGGGTFHLALPLRSTHGLEMHAFEKAFPRRPEGSTAEMEEGAMRLVIDHEESVIAEKGDDGFGSGSGSGSVGGKGGGKGVEEYRLVRIRWG
ncbi:BQ2448_2612 [Microbotryum intermedium]|uniref:BQ2448_2612 protein n=1 Tax=Microbotryum intermedium TaxID=269621 RepID=A0A238F6W2_9BASI|nr:BQ2448_2612 [Microbotryum intermedium]